MKSGRCPAQGEFSGGSLDGDWIASVCANSAHLADYFGVLSKAPAIQRAPRLSIEPLRPQRARNSGTMLSH